MNIMQSINPATGIAFQDYPGHSAEEASARVERAHFAFLEWRFTAMTERSKLLLQCAELLQQQQSSLAKLITMEMGKPIQEAKAELEKCAWVCRYYAENGGTHLQPEQVETDFHKSYVTFQPLGCVLAVMPWNFPFWQVFRFAAPALMAGNAAVLKHAENVPGCALAIESLFSEAGFPKYLFTTLLVHRDQAQSLIDHPKIAAVTLTGSTRAGKAVASHAGSQIKPSVLELGGSDPYLVLHDADLELAAKCCATSRMLNAGQSCIGAKRMIVVKERYDAFVELMKSHLSEVVWGNPEDDTTTVGPMAREDLRLNLHDQVLRSIADGATCVMGGVLPDRPGYFYPPTLLTGVTPGMPAFEEELFGPVACVSKAETEEEAIRLANQTQFGLGGAVFSTDVERAELIARQHLQCGAVAVNDFVRSDPRLPFGGIQQSGYGRELSHFGIREFVNVKAVTVNKG